jgi:hypothetical protein
LQDCRSLVLLLEPSSEGNAFFWAQLGSLCHLLGEASG